jgi:hypothetical protein
MNLIPFNSFQVQVTNRKIILAFLPTNHNIALATANKSFTPCDTNPVMKRLSQCTIKTSQKSHEAKCDKFEID